MRMTTRADAHPLDSGNPVSLEHVAHRVARLGPHAQPILDSFTLERDLLLVVCRQRIVGAELLDHSFLYRKRLGASRYRVEFLNALYEFDPLVVDLTETDDVVVRVETYPR